VRIVIKNYQSIASADLEFKGFTAVTGRTNLGKSALVRALQGALFGQAGEAFVRRGTDQAAVGIVFDDKTEVKWYKVAVKAPGRETQLVVNGQRHTKLGKDHPKLTEPIGTKEIETTAGILRPQIANQHDAIFLLAENETVVAEAFKVLGRGDVIARARELAKRDWGRTVAEQKMRSDDLVLKGKDLQRYDWVPALKLKVERAAAAQSQVVVKEAKATLVLKRAAELRALKLVAVPVLVPDRVVNTSRLTRIVMLKVLQTMPTIPIMVPDRTINLAKLSKLMALQIEQKNGAATAAALQRSRGELEQLELDTTVLEKELGACPACGRVFGHSH